MQKEANKVQYGLSNVHVGTVEIKDGVTTFGTPIAYPGAVSLKLDPEGDTSPFYSDNVVYYTTSTNNGYTGELEMAYYYDWFATQFIGLIESKEGLVVENSDANPKPMFVMFQFEGDESATKHILYNVLPSRPNIEGNTKEDKTDPSTTTIPITATPLKTDFGNIIKAKCPKTSAKYTTFFTAVPTVPEAAEVVQHEQILGDEENV